MAHLVTGHAGTEHIMPSDDGAFNAGVLGTGKYVLDLGNKFAYEIVSNNLVKIMDGALVNQGRHMNIPVNNYEEVTIENGLQSVKRYDLICMRYTKDADTSIESAELVVVKGTSSTSPSDPEYTIGDIFSGDLVDDFPLYRVRLDGLNIEGVDCLFDTIPCLEMVNAKADANNDKIDILGTFKTSNLIVGTVKTATNTIVSRITLEPGVWLVKGEFRWNGNANGLRSMAIMKSSVTLEYTIPNYNNSNIVVPPSGAAFCQSVNVIVNLTEETTFNFWAAQSSGVDIGLAIGYMQAVRLSA